MKFITITKNERGFYENFKTASFDTKDEAVEKAEEITSALYANAYILNHGEFARPEFKSQRYKDGWGIKVIWHYLAGTCHAPKDGRFCSADRFFERFFG